MLKKLAHTVGSDVTLTHPRASLKADNNVTFYSGGSTNILSRNAMHRFGRAIAEAPHAFLHLGDTFAGASVRVNAIADVCGGFVCVLVRVLICVYPCVLACMSGPQVCLYVSVHGNVAA